MPSYRIPFNRPYFSGDEFAYMQQAVAAGHLAGDGPFTKKCHAILEETTGTRKAFLTTSCTHALEMSAILADVQAGDEVIIPSFTFVSTVNAFVLRGATPVFVDVRPDTLNLDETLLESAITERTKVIVPVHYAGVGCEMDAILATAQAHNIVVVEDNAHGLFGQYKGRPLGSLGHLATQSFHETKNLTCGEGGALLVNDAAMVERAEILREKGTNRSRFFRGMVDKYTWVDIGSSWLPSDMLAAYLYAQLEQRADIQARRAHIWNYYGDHLPEWAEAHGVRLPVIPEHCEQAYHMFYILMPSQDERQALIDHLKERGILSVFHYLPLHLSDMGQSYGGKAGDCPVTEDVSERLLRLPFYNAMTDDELADVVAGLQSFEGWR